MLKQLPKKYEPGFLRELDRRTEISQRLNAVYEAILADAGGEEGLARTKLALIERFVFLEQTLQTWETEIATNPKKSEHLLSRWIQASNSLLGLAKMIGLDKRLKQSTDLKAYCRDRTA